MVGMIMVDLVLSYYNQVFGRYYVLRQVFKEGGVHQCRLLITDARQVFIQC